MIKLFFCNVVTENNFGSPCLMHGAEEIIKKLHKNYEIICYQYTKPNDFFISDFGFPIKQVPYNNKLSMLWGGIKYKLGIKPRNKLQLDFLEHIKTSDIVVDLYGILFCSKLSKDKFSYIKTIKSVLRDNLIIIIAKMFKTKTVKTPASYGPIKHKKDIITAKIAARYLFDKIYAREIKSKEQIQKVLNNRLNIPVAPDLANYMATKGSEKHGKHIGISVSYQIIRQWQSKESYILCVANLIKYILSATKHNVVLYPNEVHTKNNYNDNHVCLDITKQLNDSKRVEIVNIEKLNSTELKALIINSEVFISSRYHSCIAALSAGIPVIVIGWHHKYNELFKLYGQEKWVISNNNCTSDNLIRHFSNLYENRDAERNVINEKRKKIHEALLAAGQVLFTK